MISRGEVVSNLGAMNDFIKVMLGTFAVGGSTGYPLTFSFGHSPYNPSQYDDSDDSDGDDLFIPEETDDDYEWDDIPQTHGDDYDYYDYYDGYEPEVDEAQEWADYDPDC